MKNARARTSVFGIILFMLVSTKRSFQRNMQQLVFCLACCSYGLSQAGPASPSVSFIFDFPGSFPAHYGITVAADGHASYVSDGKVSKDSDSDQPYSADFTVSQTTTKRIFDLAQHADYFQGHLESKKKNIASTGDKTLMYQDATRSTTASYNYSSIPAVQELTTLFQNLSATLEFGHRLDYDYRYQKLALDAESKAMEDAAGRGELLELSAIAPTLHKIIDDPSVINGVRARLERVLDHADAAGK